MKSEGVEKGSPRMRDTLIFLVILGVAFLCLLSTATLAALPRRAWTVDGVMRPGIDPEDGYMVRVARNPPFRQIAMPSWDIDEILTSPKSSPTFVPPVLFAPPSTPTPEPTATLLPGVTPSPLPTATPVPTLPSTATSTPRSTPMPT